MKELSEFVNEKNIDAELNYVGENLLDLLITFNKLKANDWKSRVSDVLSNRRSKNGLSIFFDDFLLAFSIVDKSKSQYALEQDTKGFKEDDKVDFIYNWFNDHFGGSVSKSSILNNTNNFRRHCLSL